MTDPKKQAEQDAILAQQIISENKLKQLPSRQVEQGDRLKLCRLLMPKQQLEFQ